MKLLRPNTSAPGKFLQNPIVVNAWPTAGAMIFSHSSCVRLVAGKGQVIVFQLVDARTTQPLYFDSLLCCIWSAHLVALPSNTSFCLFILPSGAISTPRVVVALLKSSLLSLCSVLCISFTSCSAEVFALFWYCHMPLVHLKDVKFHAVLQEWWHCQLPKGPPPSDSGIILNCELHPSMFLRVSLSFG